MMYKMSTPMQQNNQRVLAIDPGYERLGVAILENDTLLFSDCIQTSKNLSHPERLQGIGDAVLAIINKYSPDVLAIEKLFWGTNQKTALLVSESRGVVLLEAARAGLHIREFSPAEIKIAVTGHGRSTKDQIIKMVPKIISIEKDIKFDDEYDAIATGLTCLATREF